MVLVDLGGHSLVGGEGSGAVLDDPGPHVLPEVDQVDLGVADDLAVPASGALVHGVHELGAEGDLPLEESVEGAGAGLVQLVDVIDLPSGGHGLPGSLVVGLADVDAVSALQACGEHLLHAGELDELGFLDFDLYHVADPPDMCWAAIRRPSVTASSRVRGYITVIGAPEGDPGTVGA